MRERRILTPVLGDKLECSGSTTARPLLFWRRIGSTREKGHHQRAEAEASQPKESKPRSLPQKPRPYSGPGPDRASDQKTMRFSRTGSASKVARSFFFSSWPGAWFLCGKVQDVLTKPPRPRAELVVCQINLELGELRQVSKALHHCRGAGIASLLSVESAVGGSGSGHRQTSAWGCAKAWIGQNDPPSHATEALGLRLLPGSEQSALPGSGPTLF